MLRQAFLLLRSHMENTVQNKKNSIDALARIVSDMQQLYMVAQNMGYRNSGLNSGFVTKFNA